MSVHCTHFSLKYIYCKRWRCSYIIFTLRLQRKEKNYKDLVFLLCKAPVPPPPSYTQLPNHILICNDAISFPGQPLLTLAIQSINQSFSKLFKDRKLFTFSGFFRVYPRLRVFKIVRSVFRGSGFLRALVVRGLGFNLFHNNLDACS